jgi:hypothetical protein
VCRRYQRTRLNILRSLLSVLNWLIVALQQRLQTSKWKTFLKTSHPHKAQFWKLARYFKAPPPTIPPPFKNDKQIYQAEEKANLLATKFESVHAITIPRVPTPHSLEVEHLLEAFMTRHRRGSTTCPPIRITEVRRVLSALKCRTAPGMDEIAPILLRHFPTVAIAHLSSLFTSALTLGHFPSSWKQATVIAIPKPRKPPTHPNSYRPISLLSAISKVLERIIARRLEHHVQQTHIIPNEQFGFRKRQSTVAQLTRITDFISHGYNLKKHTGMVLLDIEKAYDTIWTNGLICKLIKNRFPAYVIHLLQSYLSDCTFTVIVDGARSSSRPQRAGLPQGAVYHLYCSRYTSLICLVLRIFIWHSTPMTQHSLRNFGEWIQLFVDFAWQ